MPVSELRPRTSRKALLEAADHLPPREFNRFWTDLQMLRARRLRSRPNGVEREILARIQKSFPSGLKRQLQRWTAKLESESLSPEEGARLRDLAFQREEWHAARMQALVELANLRMETL